MVIAIIYVLSIFLYFYILRKHHIRGTHFRINDEVAAFVFILGLVPIFNAIFAIYLWIEFIGLKWERKWYEVLLFIKKER